MDTILELRDISKRFGDVQANDRVSLSVRQGEIHGLVGENGAGKTTLMNILFGLHQPDEGEIWWRGSPLEVHSPEDAIAAGIGMVHQHFMLVPTLTVAENVALGTQKARLRPLNLADLSDRIADVEQQYGLHVDPSAPVGALSVGEKQRVEIVKTLERGADLVILDEPTSVLIPQEVEDLFTVLRKLAESGKAVIFISHKLHEVLAICDRITVLRDGSVRETVARADATIPGLARAMVGLEDIEVEAEHRAPSEAPAVVRVRGLTVDDDAGTRRLSDVSFDIGAGEIFGIAGVSGNGQVELVRALFGLERVAAGEVWIGTRETTHSRPHELVGLGIGYVPEDRVRDGVVLPFSVRDNLLLKDYRVPPYSRGRVLLDRTRMQERAADLMEQYSIRAASLEQRLSHLSGGNQQRVVLARELSREPEFLIASQPTQGLDIRSQLYVERLLLSYRDRGAAILLVSTELEQIRTLCDRAAVMVGGRFTGIVDPTATPAEEFGVLMGGGAAVG